VTAILLTCSYNNQEFFRCGFYVNNVYDNEEMNMNPPETVEFTKILRNILSDKPRVTKFNIDWDSLVNVIPSYNNYMFNDKAIKENVQNDFLMMKNEMIYSNTNQNLESEEQVKNIFYNINNNI
jgi:hypothetical protein